MTPLFLILALAAAGPAAPIALESRSVGNDLLVVSIQNQTTSDIASIAGPTSEYKLTQALVVFYHADGDPYPPLTLPGTPRPTIVPPGGGATAFLDARELVDLSRLAGVPQAPGFRVPFQVETRYGGQVQAANACTLILGRATPRPHTEPMRPLVKC